MKHKYFDSVYPYGYFLVRKSDNKKYVGIRYANVKKNLTPNQDFGKVYFTSGRMEKEFKTNPENFTFKIAYTFDSIEELFEWERKIALRIYKRKDWANMGWGQNYGDNPEIGQMISEGKNKLNSEGISSVEIGANKLKEWIWTTNEGKDWRNYFSKMQKQVWSERTDDQKSEMQRKRISNMDFKAAREKARIKLDQIGDDGLTGNQRNSLKARDTRKEKGIDSEIGKKRNEKLNKKLGEMSEEEFEKYCEGKALCFVNGAKTRRKRFQESQVELTNQP